MIITTYSSETVEEMTVFCLAHQSSGNHPIDTAPLPKGTYVLPRVLQLLFQLLYLLQNSQYNIVLKYQVIGETKFGLLSTRVSILNVCVNVFL